MLAQVLALCFVKSVCILNPGFFAQAWRVSGPIFQRENSWEAQELAKSSTHLVMGIFHTWGDYRDDGGT